MQRKSGVLIAVSVVAGLLAAWLVFDITSRSERRGGRMVPVLVSAIAIERGDVVNPDEAERVARVRMLPSGYVPTQAIRSVAELAGSRAVADLPIGTLLVAPFFESATNGGVHRLRRSERAVTIDARVAPAGTEIAAGASVDVYASGLGRPGSTQLLLAAAEVLDSVAAGAGSRLTLRVAAAQTAPLVRGDVFARELRAVLRP